MNLKPLFLLFTFIPFIGFSQFVDKKVYNIEKVQNPPKIDGELNDKVWANLTIANNFSQISPNNGTPERQHQKTEVKILRNREMPARIGRSEKIWINFW